MSESTPPMADHLTAEMLDTLVRGALDAAALASADRHLGGCDACRQALASRLANGAALLALVRGEARRHLTFDELEAQLGGGELDGLAAQHLASCDGCRRELEDLRAFDRIAPAPAEEPSRGASEPAASPWGRWLRIAIAAATPVAIALVFLVPRWQTEPAMRATVRLASPAVATPAPAPTFRLGAAAELPRDVQFALARAREAARDSRAAQTLTVRVTALEYVALVATLDSDGDSDAPPPSAFPSTAAADARVPVVITLIPPP